MTVCFPYFCTVNKKLLYILIVSICISLLGIIIVQFFWIRNAFQVKESQFSRSVNDALGSVVENLEARENMYFISRNFEGDSIMRIVKAFTKDTTQVIKERLDSLMALNEMPVARGKHPLPPPPPPTPDHHRGPPAGVIHYSYQYNVVPIQHGIDSVTVSMEQVFQEMPPAEMDEFSFEWNDQFSRIDSLMDLNSPEAMMMPGAHRPGPGENEGEIIIDTVSPGGATSIRYIVPQYNQHRQQSPVLRAARYFELSSLK